MKCDPTPLQTPLEAEAPCLVKRSLETSFFFGVKAHLNHRQPEAHRPAHALECCTFRRSARERRKAALPPRAHGPRTAWAEHEANNMVGPGRRLAQGRAGEPTTPQQLLSAKSKSDAQVKDAGVTVLADAEALDLGAELGHKAVQDGPAVFLLGRSREMSPPTK